MGGPPVVVAVRSEGAQQRSTTVSRRCSAPVKPRKSNRANDTGEEGGVGSASVTRVCVGG